MKREQDLFMQALGAALTNDQVTWGPEVSEGDLGAVLQLARIHKVLPMVFQAVYRCPAAQSLDTFRLRRDIRQMVALQARRTAELQPLIRDLRAAGLHPLVVKGITCRRLYPVPDLRLSSDEDIWVPEGEFSRCHEILLAHGLSTQDDPGGYEVSYTGRGSTLYLEVHKTLFPTDSQAYGEMNRFFANAPGRSVEVEGIPTLCPTDHMLYLLCHAFKHFLHSGFGIRQVSDMILFANAYGSEIDWRKVLDRCRQIRAEQFAAGLFRIGRRYLHLSLEESRLTLPWQAIYVDEEPLLEDILASGVYGGAEKSRRHSSNITLQAVARQKNGVATGGLMKSLFPSAKTLEPRYPYLKDNKLLLPLAWADRMVKYSRETNAQPDTAATDSLRIGKERVDLLKKYGILDKN